MIPKYYETIEVKEGKPEFGGIKFSLAHGQDISSWHQSVLQPSLHKSFNCLFESVRINTATEEYLFYEL